MANDNGETLFDYEAEFDENVRKLVLPLSSVSNFSYEGWAASEDVMDRYRWGITYAVRCLLNQIEDYQYQKHGREVA